MRGTTSSSRTLLTLSHKAAIREFSCLQLYHSRCRRSRCSSVTSPAASTSRCSSHYKLVLLALIFFIVASCDGGRIAGGKLSGNQISTRGQSFPTGNHNQMPLDNNDKDNAINHASDEFYIDEKEDDVKTIRFVNGKTKSEESPKHHHHHREHKHRSSQRSKADQRSNNLKTGEEDGDDNEVQVRVNFKKGHKGIQQNNVGDGDINPKAGQMVAVPVVENNYIKIQTERPTSPPFDSRALKVFAEEVADTILAEADRLYAAMESGDFTPTSLEPQFPSSFDAGDYIICQ